ncbi:MAG: hypothetical protein HY314_03970 [Acidobacteria bacterium]|nr:hypothetical protein [Acidobacteriota bacterium]
MNRRKVITAFSTAFVALFMASVLSVTSLIAHAAYPPETAQRTARPDLPNGVERVTSVEGITEYRLSNGLRVLLFPDPSKETVVTP